jgi:hypothetical protein
MFDGSAWGVRTDIDAATAIDAISCVTGPYCVAVDAAGNALTYNGQAWSAAIPTGDPNALESVSCTSSSFCVAFDAFGAAIAFDGTAWSSRSSVFSPPPAALLSVSCADPAFCIAVQGDTSSTYDGSIWTTPIYVANDQLMSVSCGSTSFCVVSDAQGGVVILDDGVWVPNDSLYRANYAGGVSCVSASFCVSSSGADVATYDGTDWTTVTQVGYGTIDSVSCPVVSLCVAATSTGTAVTFQPGTSPPAAPAAPAPSSAPAERVPVNVIPPKVSGSPYAGDVLTCSPGGWSGTLPETFAYQWLSNGAALATQTGPTYATSATDVGHAIACEATATNGAGTSSLLSNAVMVLRPDTELRAALQATLAQTSRASIKALRSHPELSLEFSAPLPGTITVSWRARVKSTGHRRSSSLVTIASDTDSFTAPSPQRITLRLDALGRRALKRSSRLRVSAKTTFDAPGIVTVSATKTFTLR